MNDSYDLGLKLNVLIMDIGVRGNMGGMAPVDISWQRIGRYLVAYIEDHDEGAYFFRIFRYPNQAYYEEYRILHPSYEEDKYECLYDSVERGNNRTQLHFAKSSWIYDFFAICKEHYYVDNILTD